MNTTETETFVRQHPPRQILSDLYGYAWDISDHATRKAWEYVNVTGERRTLAPVSDAQESLFNNVLRGTGSLVLAIEAFSTVSFASNYFRDLKNFDVKGPATVQIFFRERILGDGQASRSLQAL